MSSKSASWRPDATCNTQVATCSPLRLGRALPRMIPIRLTAVSSLVATSSKYHPRILRRASTLTPMARTGQRPAVAPLSDDEEAFLRAWSRAALIVPRALDADLMSGQGMSLTEYTALMHLSEAPGRTMRMSDLASACALSL